MKIKYSDYGNISLFLKAVTESCLAEMTEETKQSLREECDPIMRHLGIGVYIRNEFIYPQRALLPTATEADRLAIERLLRRADDYSQEVVDGILAVLCGE